MHRRLACIALFALALPGIPAFAAQRTFVATTGLDSNPCSVGAPCRSFGIAIAATDPSGEVIVLDSGGYGAVAIAKSVTITSPAGVYAGISVFGGDGVLVNGAGVVVTLRGLTINGIGAFNGTGVRFQQGARLVVDRCNLGNLTGAGIDVQAPAALVEVTDTTIAGAYVGIRTSVDASATSILAVRVRIAKSTTNGIDIPTATNLTLRDVTIAGNANAGVYVFLSGAGKRSRVEIDRLASTFNGDGGVVLLASGDATTVVEGSIARSLLADNGTYGLWTTGNFVAAQANNQVTVVDSVVRGNGSIGLYAVFGLPTAYLVAARNVITGNAGLGINTNAGTGFQSRGDNAVFGNNAGGSQTSGAITGLGGV